MHRFGIERSPLLRGVRFHRIVTEVCEGDLDQATKVEFRFYSGAGGSYSVIYDAREEGQDVVNSALAAVAEHDALEDAFENERSMGRDADVWRLQTLRKAVKTVHNELPENLISP